MAAILTATQILDRARKRSGDANSSAYATSDTDALVAMNAYYFAMKAMSSDRIQTLVGSVWHNVTSQNQGWITTKITTIRKIFRMYQLLDDPDVGVAPVGELEKIEQWDMDRYLVDDAAPSATTLRWSIEETSTDTPASVGIKKVFIHPSASSISQRYLIKADVQNTVLDLMTVTTPDFASGEDYILADMLAAELALNLGQPGDFIDRIRANVPDVYQAITTQRDKKSVPQRRPQEDPV